MASFYEIKECRVAKSNDLVTVLNLGIQSLTGVFPSSETEKVTEAPLELAWSPSSQLLQLRHSFAPEEMYGDNYGYRSGLNQSMVTHLQTKVSKISRKVQLLPGDTVLDIGSNDGTLLAAYGDQDIELVGIDPTAKKFREFYPTTALVVEDFFSEAAFISAARNKAKIVTSIAMFYDLESPVDFAKEVKRVLHAEGIWHFEQSYMPSMLRTNSYDTICHEHLEYYSLKNVVDILGMADLKLIDVSFNNINGGSFACTATHSDNESLEVDEVAIDWLLGQEQRMGLNTPEPFRQFEKRVFQHREDLIALISAINKSGKTVAGYGASTKGNVLLQFCGFDKEDIPYIAEVNSEKFGRVTPGSRIPIVSESEARNMKPDYFLVLPWHFRDGILKREEEFLASGGKFIFPFPEIEIV